MYIIYVLSVPRLATLSVSTGNAYVAYGNENISLSEREAEYKIYARLKRERKSHARLQTETLRHQLFTVYNKSVLVVNPSSASHSVV